MMLMGFGSALGDTGVPLVDDALAYVQGKAQAGAEAAIPDVKAAIQPYVIASLMLGLIGAMFGLSAFIGVRSLKKTRGAS